MQQEEHKAAGKQLRDTVKWMAADLESWLKTLQQRLEYLDHLYEKMLNKWSEDSAMGEAAEFMEQIRAEAVIFMDLDDAHILHSERPNKVREACGWVRGLCHP